MICKFFGSLCGFHEEVRYKFEKEQEKFRNKQKIKRLKKKIMLNTLPNFFCFLFF